MGDHLSCIAKGEPSSRPIASLPLTLCIGPFDRESSTATTSRCCVCPRRCSFLRLCAPFHCRTDQPVTWRAATSPLPAGVHPPAKDVSPNLCPKQTFKLHMQVCRGQPNRQMSDNGQCKAPKVVGTVVVIWDMGNWKWEKISFGNSNIIC